MNENPKNGETYLPFSGVSENQDKDPPVLRWSGTFCITHEFVNVHIRNKDEDLGSLRGPPCF